MRICCIARPMGRHRDLQMPEFDGLILIGEFTKNASVEETEDFIDWIGSFDKPSMVVPGPSEIQFETWANHWHVKLAAVTSTLLVNTSDFLFSRAHDADRRDDALVAGYSKSRLGTDLVRNAFQADPSTTSYGKDARRMDPYVHILATYTPIHGHLDQVTENGEHIGDTALSSAINNMRNMKYAVCGQIPSLSGQTSSHNGNYVRTDIQNVCVTNENDEIIHDPFVIDVRR